MAHINLVIMKTLIGLIYLTKLSDGAACASGQTNGKIPTTDSSDTGSGRTFILNSADNDYLINCCGFVTTWEFYVTTTNGTLYAQVWRQMSGAWTLIGQNSFDIETANFNAVFIGSITASQQISVQAGDFIGFMSSGLTIPPYDTTNMGSGSSNEDVIYSDTATGTVGSTATFLHYRNNIEFSIKATLSPGNTPQFVSLPTTLSVDEDTAVGTTLITVTATDADLSDNLNYTLTSTNPASTSFNFDPISGNLTTLTTLTVGTTVFSFSVVDLCGNTESATFTLSVANQPPVFQNLPNTTEISEDLSEETELFILTVTDPTVGDVVTCSLNSLVPTTNDLYFYYSVGRSRYSIYLRGGASLDYDTAREYLMAINCTDTKNSVSSTFVVYVAKNEPPVITNLPASVSVSPNTIVGTSIFTVTTTDKESAQLFYNMTCIPSECPFKIFASGAVLTESSVVNVTEPGFDLYIYVFDGKNLVGPKVLTVQMKETDSTSTSASTDWLSTDAKYILIILTIFAGLATFAVIGFCVLVFKKSPKSKSRNIIKIKHFP
nr:protocadherin-11 X-linked [Crassostrea gigas]